MSDIYVMIYHESDLKLKIKLFVYFLSMRFPVAGALAERKAHSFQLILVVSYFAVSPGV